MSLICDMHGLRKWRDVLHPDAYFTADVDYTKWFPKIGGKDIGKAIGAYSKYVSHDNALLYHHWVEGKLSEIRGTITIRPLVDSLKVWGFSRLHIPFTDIEEVYPPLTTVYGKSTQVFFPSESVRVGGRAWVKSKDGRGVYIALNGNCIHKRHLFFWEKYPDNHLALHLIFYWPMKVNEEENVFITISNKPIPFPTYYNDLEQSFGKPVIQCVRAMAESVSDTNPFGYVNTRLDRKEEAIGYIRNIVRKSAVMNKKPLGIIGWPWGYTKGFGVSNGKHSYPYNAFSVPEPLRSNLMCMESELARDGMKFGALYRPHFFTVNNENDCWRYGDKTGVASIVCDFLPFKPSLLYLDDCGVDQFDDPEATGVNDLVKLLGSLRSVYGNSPIWYVEHPSTATLPYAGGYVVLEKHEDGKLIPNLGYTQWEILKKMYPTASWLVAAGPKRWGNLYNVQKEVVDWCLEQGGNVSPLIEDWLL